MARTFLQLQDEAMFDSFDSTKYRPLVKTWMNEAMGRLSSACRLPSLDVTGTVEITQGDAFQLLPGDLVRLQSLHLGAQLLPEVSVGEMDGLAAATGSPEVFALDGLGVRVWPAPNVNVTLAVRYWRAPTFLSGDTDEPDLPDAWRDLLVTYARFRLFRAEDDLQAAGTHEQQWVTGRRELMAEVASRSRQRVRQIGDDRWRGGSTRGVRRPS